MSSGDGRAFEYWHIRPRVRDGQDVTARRTVLGHVKAPSNHVHLTEYEGSRVVNPLVPGRLTPYHDSSPPRVRGIMLRRTNSDRELLPNFVRGRVEIVADAEDSPTEPGRCAWHGPVGPALSPGRSAASRAGPSCRSESPSTLDLGAAELVLLARIRPRDVSEPDGLRKPLLVPRAGRLPLQARAAVRHPEPSATVSTT